MKRLSKTLILFFALMVLTLVPAVTSEAASAYPKKVSNLKASTVSDTSVKLTWSKVSGANGYSVYSVNQTTGAEKKIGTAKSNSCIIKKLQIGQTYQYRVYAYKKSGGKTYKSKKPSNTVTVKTKLSKPGAIKNFRLICRGDESAFLGWDKSKNADKYIVYQYNESTKTYKKIGTTKETTYQVKKLDAGEKYYFKVQAYHSAQGQKAYGKISDKVSVTAKSVNVSAIHGRRYVATLKQDTTVTVNSTGAKKKLKKGTTLIVSSQSSGTKTASLKDGTKVTVKGSSMTYGNLSFSKAYSTEQKEAFVNGKGYTSETDYLIWVSQATCNTSIFKGSKGQWKLVRSFKCVVGKYGHTPTGRFKILKHVTYLNGLPAYHFTWNSSRGGGNAFHCLLNGKTSGALSGGCVRVATSDLNFIGKYCKPGTTVISY